MTFGAGRKEEGKCLCEECEEYNLVIISSELDNLLIQIEYH